MPQIKINRSLSLSVVMFIDLLDILKPKGAMLLSWLIQVQQQKFPGDSSGWFECTMDTVQTQLRMSPRDQVIWFGRLKKNRYISTERRGMPSTRWIQLNYSKIKRALEAIA